MCSLSQTSSEPAPHSSTLTSRLLASICLIAALSSQVGQSSENPPPDPAEELSKPASLGFDEYETFKGLFKKLSDRDFDARDSAMRRLVARGPAVFGLAREYASSADAEVAAQAKSIHSKVLLEYDGFLPTSKDLERRLAKPIELRTAPTESSVDALRRLAGKHGVTLLFDQRVQLRAQSISDWVLGPTLGAAFTQLAAVSGVVAIPRGDVLLVTGSRTAERLNKQRRTLDWKKLKLTRDEAARVGEALDAFFPAGTCELHTGSLALSVRGVPAAIKRAARMIALLDPETPAACWPLPRTAENIDQAYGILAKPASLVLVEDDPVLAFSDLRKQGHPVVATAGGKAFDRPPYPVVFHALAPVSLKVRNVPLGLVLRWFTSRARFADQQMSQFLLRSRVAEGARVEVMVGTKARDTLSLSVGGRDVSFLMPKGDDPGPETDRTIQHHLVRVLRHHLSLFPGFDAKEDMRVVRGRLLLQASPIALTWTLKALDQWKREGKPPKCAWHEDIMARLRRVVDWDGRGLPARKVLRTLRALGEFPVFLEDAADGRAAHFRLTPKQAELLQPGKYRLSLLFDDLAEKAGARWYVRWGGIVLTPADEEPEEPVKK